jgi:N-methylhydantoinase A
MRVGIDIGGTFTDFVIYDEKSGQFATHKILSTPHDPSEAVLVGLEELSAARTPLAGAHIIHGSTVATNALLERKGATTALITTEGFRDLLEIGRQNRPDIYDLFSRRPPPLVPAEQRYEVAERVDRHGQPIRPLDPASLDHIIGALRAAGVTSVAVCLLFSFLYPDHEILIAEQLQQAGFSVSISSVVLPEFREYERTSTTVVNAYVSPVMDRYLGRLERESQAADFRVMQSNGGSIRASQARRGAVRCVLSGPAGGVVGARYVAEAAGFGQLITFDMGGTSTDVSLCAGNTQLTTESEIGGMPIRIPMIDIHTVGSGGGSMAYVDAGGALRVGPQSAGADPGPVCYGRGGQEPTVTDANLVLGRLAADQFLGGQMTLDRTKSEAALTRLAGKAGLATHSSLSLAQTAALGIIEVVNAHMERALRVISIQRGHDPREFILVSFGGAGALHASDLARSLNIPRVLVPPSAATLSAFGMLAADVIKDYVRTIMRPGETAYEELELLISPLAEQGQTEVIEEGVAAGAVTLERLLDVRYRGQSYELSVPLTPDFASAFHHIHAHVYGYSEPGVPIEIVNLRLRAIGHLPRPPLIRLETESESSPKPFDQRPVVLANGLAAVPFYQGSQLRPGHVVTGPAIITQSDTTVYLAADDKLEVDRYRNFVIEVG